jgi:hypothetical protein
LWQLGATIEATPIVLRALDELEVHDECGLVRDISFCADGAVAGITDLWPAMPPGTGAAVSATMNALRLLGPAKPQSNLAFNRI